MSRLLLRLLGAAALAAALLPAPPVRGQDGPSSPGPWDEVVFLPESGLSVLLEKDPRGVLLDGSNYLDLHRRAREAGGGGASLPGPAVRLLRVVAEGTVEGDRARVLVRLTLLHRGPGRDILPIPVGGSVLSATLDGAPATLSSDGKGTPLLAVEGAGFHEAVIEVTATVERRQGDRTLVLALPAAPAARWSLTVPGRVTGRAGQGLARTERLTDPDATRFVSYGAAGGISASWREGDEGTDLPPLLRGRVRILAEVGERAMDVLVLLRLECWRSPAGSFLVDLPADLALLGVEGEATLQPEGEPAAGVARHRLRFPEPFTGARAVILRASRSLDGPGVAALPVVDLPGAAADRVLAVRFTDGLRGRVEPGAGAVRLDPALSEQGAVDALLRLDAGASALAISERPSVRLRADARVLLDLADDGPWLAASILYLPRGDRLYGVDPLLPEGFLPETVAVSGDLPFLRGTTPGGRLSLVFPGGVAPGSAVTVTLRGRWPVAGWSAEDAAERTAPLPRFDAGTAVENPSDVEGWLGVSAPAGVDVREEETTGLVPVPVADLRDRAGFTADGLVLGWRFRGSSPGGRVRAVRPEPSVTASVALLVTPLEDHLALLGVVAVRVQRSGIREVRFTVEPSAGDLLRVEGVDIAEKRRVREGGKDTWIVRLGRRVRDGTRLVLRAELPLEKGAAAVPLVRVEGAARRELSVGVAAGGELEVETESRGLRPADPADLAPVMGGAVRGLLRAWKGDGESVPSLRVSVRRLPAEPLPSAFADGISLRTVIGMDSIARTRLVARVRNADRQALEVTLPAGASLHSARVAGEAVRPVRTAAGSLLVPIVPSAEPFELMLFYEEALPPGGGAASLRAPDLGIAGAAATWTVRLPEGSLALSATGDFASPPERPGMPLCVRILRGIPRIFDGATLGLDRGAPGFAPMKAVPVPSAAPRGAMEGEAEEESVPETMTAVPVPSAAPAREPAAAAGTRGRAAKRGLFAMDIRLLEAGPAVTASRLGGTGSLELTWRSASGRAAAALLAGILAFLTALLARRRGVPAPSWTLLALGLFTALPVVLGAVDTAPFDGAAAGTLAYAALALALAAARKFTGGRLSLAAAATVALLLLSSPAEAKGGTREGAPAPPIPAPAPDDPVYVLYDPSRPETLRVPERVFLPYEHYRALWNAAHPDRLFSEATAPVLVAAAYAGRVEDRTLVLEARFEVDPGDGGVLALPPGAAVSDLRVDGLPVPATTAAPGGALLVPLPRGAAGARSVVEATLRWALGGDPPGGVLRAPIPRAPRARLLLVLPLPDPALRLAALGGFTAVPAGESTRVEADLGPLGLLDIAWQPRGADAAGGRTRFEAETEADAVMRPGILEWRATITVRVLAGTVSEVEADLPAGLELQSVSGAPVASWTVTPARVLRVRLLGEGPGERSFDVLGLIPAPDPAAAAEIPLLSLKGASADRLRVSVAAVDGRVVPVQTAGMERTDAAGSLAAGGLAFRRLRTPARLAVRMEPWPAEITVASRLHLHLGAEESLLRAEMDVTPGPRGMFEGVVLLPVGWTLEDATGADPFPLPGAVRLVFRGSSHEARRIVLRLRGPVPGPDAVPFPLLRLREGTRESADLLVSTAPGFAAGASSAEGLDAVPADRFASWPALEPGEIRSLAWHDGRGGGSVSVAREALRPTLRPTVVADLTVLDDRVIVDALVHYEIRGGMERVFRVDAPPGVVDPWVLGEGLREVRRETVDGRERLTVTLQAPATGAASFRVLYDLPVPPGGAVTVAGPVPVDGEGARAFLLLRALGDAEVRVGPAPGLDPCDVADLPLIPAGLDPLSVLRFLRARDAAWRLPLTLVAHEMGDLPEARIHLVDGTTVADRDGSARTRVAARLFNRSRSFLPVALPAGAELEAVLVGGVPVRPVKRVAEPGVVQVPVRVQSLGEESQEVVLTYRTPATAPGGRFDRLEPRLPSFPGVPVDATTWRLVLPGDRDYSFSGNMDPVEAVEVAIARAEAYASDVARLRQVVQSGTLSQREVAAENLAQNAQEMKDSLDVAQSRMAELEQAAADGRVDRSRLDAGRRKAAELARDIEEALGDVRANTARQGPQSDPAYGGPAGEAEKSKQEEAARYATKEGQSFKKWTSNKTPAQEDADRAGGKAQQQRAQRLLDMDEQTLEAGKSRGEAKGDADKALAAHELFDVSFREANLGERLREGWAARGGIDESVAGVAIPVQGATAGGRVFLGLVGTLPGAIDDINLQPSGGAGFALPQSGWGGDGGGGGYRYHGAAGGGGGGGGILLKSAGVVSLSPPLVEQGRSWSFRKLDAGAEITVKARTPGLGRRFGAAAAFLLLAGLVFLAGRRRAARAARA